VTPLLLALLAAPAQENDRKLTPEEIRRRLDEAFQDAEAASKKYKAWTARIRSTEAAAEEGHRSFNGRVWVKSRALFADLKRTKEMNGGDVLDTHLKLGRERTFEVAVESEKVLYKVDLTKAFLPETLLRDGFVKELEERFVVEIVSNARYAKTKPTLEDLKILGFESEEAWKKWLEDAWSEGGGKTKGPVKEFNPFHGKEMEFHKNNPRSMPEPEKSDGAFALMYYIRLTPKAGPIADEYKQSMLTLRPADFLPVRIDLTFQGGHVRHWNLEGHEPDPKPEIEDAIFKIDSTGYTVREEKP
jgi:hypothetical protein